MGQALVETVQENRVLASKHGVGVTTREDKCSGVVEWKA
jgi:hypothetical protein